MDREQAIQIARECAKAKPQSYYAEPFEPHEWVIDAIMQAASAQETRTEAAPEPPEATWICDCGRSNYVTMSRCEGCERRRNPERLALNRGVNQ